MRNLQILASLILLSNAGAACLAAEDADLAKKNAELQQKVDKLDKEMAELKKAVMQSGASADAQPPKKPVWSNLDIQLYGYIKLDASYDDSRIETGNYAKWVERETASDDDQFNMTANQSRFGMIINGPDDGLMKASGRAEVDFYGSGDAENKAHPMMRHAYMKLDWPEDRFSILAGQTSDVVSPLLPSTLNYTVGWWTGNIGYRRPQVRLTKEYEIGPQKDLKLEGALARTIGRDNTSLDGTLDSGEDSGVPTLQARASMTFPLYGPKPSTVGISGHLGEEEYDTTLGGQNKEFESWSLDLDVTQPVNKWLSIEGEMFTGENLDAYMGGIGQGVTTSGANQYEEIGSKGGWIAASLGPWGKKRFNIGLGMDDVERGNVNASSTNPGRTLNQSVFANMFYSLNKNTEWAVELSHWRTEYRGTGNGDSLRAQTSLIYKF